MGERLTVAQALEQVEKIERNLDAWQGTAPLTITALGGRDALLRRCEMTCIGPMPRLDEPAWERMAGEYEENREHGRTGNRGT